MMNLLVQWVQRPHLGLNEAMIVMVKLGDNKASKTTRLAYFFDLQSSILMILSYIVFLDQLHLQLGT